MAVEQADAVGQAFGQESCGQIGGCAIQAALHKGQVVELDAQVLDPLLVRLAVGQVGLNFLIVDHAALLQINQEHLAGLQAPFTNDFVLGHGQNARLGAHDHQVIVGDAVARWAQAIAVQGSADLAAIGEDNAGRAVPGLQHGGVVLIKSAAALVHGAVLLPGLGDHHHHRLADRVAGHGQQFEAVVKSGGVGLAGEADRVELLQVGAEHRRGHHAFPGLHPVVVALDGVDLAVVRHIAVGVGQRPLGEGVGGKALVHQAQGRDTTRVFEIAEIGAHLVGQQQALVNHGAAGHAGHVILFAVLELQVLDGGTGGLANHIQLALQRVLHDHIVAAANKHLAQHRLFVAHSGGHRHLAVDRHITPAQQHLALGSDGPLHLLLAGQPAGMLLGQKDHANAILARRRQRHALRRHLLPVQGIRQLHQDTRPIPHQLVSPHRAAMVQVFENLERVLDNRMALLAPDMRHKTNATGVMLIRTVI